MTTTSHPATAVKDEQLKLALCRMVPDQIYVSGATAQVPRWKGRGSKVEDTEWLHACWLVEQIFDEHQFAEYQERLANLSESVLPWKRDRFAISASWQQRTIALCRVKGIEI